jgi:hypothetical protein
MLALLAVLASANLTRAAADSVPDQRLIRVERPWWRRVLAAPVLLVDAFHWPLEKFLAWGESVRIDRRLVDAVLWKDNDDQPIPEPAKDESGDHTWWDFYESTTLYRVERAVDLGVALPALGRMAGLAAPDEAVNVNAFDEVPDSTWFTNRQGRGRLSAAALERGPDLGPPPSADGPLVVLSGKELGTQPGFWIRDARGDTYLVKFDPRGFPDLATGAEVVSSRILYALGWNVAEYHLFRLDPARLSIDPQAWMLDRYNRKEPMTRERLASILATAARGPDGLIRASASRRLAGVVKGGFHMTGERRDDPNDTVPHEERRDLRGLRVVAAWIDHIDFRAGNTLDTFLRDEGDPGGRGHLVHYLIDLNGTLGSWGTGWKSPWMGHEYVYETCPAIARHLRLSHPGWMHPSLVHPAIGYFDADNFDPDEWKPIYRVAPFDQATLRDAFWGARLVASLDEADLRAIVASGDWTDPAAGQALVRILRERQRRIAERYFDPRRINPLDEVEIDAEELRFRDLGVATGVAQAASARYRLRAGDEVVESSATTLRIPRATEPKLELETSHDAGHTWSPPLRISVAGGRVIGLERLVR